MEIQAEVLFVSRANKNHNLLLTFFQESVKGCVMVYLFDGLKLNFFFRLPKSHRQLHDRVNDVAIVVP